MKNLKHIIIIVLVCLAVGAGYYFMLDSFKDQVSRLQNNLEQALGDNNSKILKLTKKEFKQLQKQQNDSLLRKLMDSVQIKFKHIERTINHNYVHTYDTTRTILIQYENTPDFYFDKKLDSCLQIKGHIDLADSTIYFDQVHIDYSSKTIYYWKRKRKIFGIQFGRKKHYALTENNCTGQTEVQEIEIVKR